MKNKNGFIASSLMFSFFLVFILLTVLVLTSYTHYNLLINNLNGDILDDLNTNIAKKYVAIRNFVRNGTFVQSGSSIPEWEHSNMTRVNNGVVDLYAYFPRTNEESYFGQNFSFETKNMNEAKKIYVSFKYQKPLVNQCTNSSFSINIIDPNGTKYTSSDLKISYLTKSGDLNKLNLIDFACGNQVGYNFYGMIIELPNIINSGNGYKIEFRASGLNYTYIANEGSTFVGFNNVLVSDVTGISNNNDELLKYLLVDLPYIDYGKKYSLPKKM